MTLRRVLVSCLLVPLALAPAACENEDARAARAAFEAMDAAIDASDGATAISYMAEETFPFYDEVVRLALSAPGDKVRALPPSQKGDVLLARNRCTAEQLRKMDGRAWVKHVIDQGWWAVEPGEESPWAVGRITAARGAGKGEIVTSGKPTGRYWRFYFIDGGWKVDLREIDLVNDRLIEEAAREWNQSVDSFLVDWEAHDYGLTRTNLWAPLE